MKTWHYITASSNSATVEEENLLQLIDQRIITPQTFVWCQGMPQWQPAIEVLREHFNQLEQQLPPPVPAQAVSRAQKRCAEIDFEIIGDDLQMVEIELDANETVIAEAGAMNYMEEGISFEARAGDGSSSNNGVLGTLLGMGKRMLTGESLFMTHFTNTSYQKRRVAFAAPYPGCIIPVDMGEFSAPLICQRDAFLCAAKGTKLDIAFNRRLGSGLFGGEGFILQRIEGDGMVFLHAGGTVIRKELKGEKLLVDTGCLVAFSQGIDYNIERAGGLKTMFFGGEGLFLATLQGTGTVWLQSMPFSRLADRILACAPSGGGKATGESSLFGGMLSGD